MLSWRSSVIWYPAQGMSQRSVPACRFSARIGLRDPAASAGIAVTTIQTTPTTAPAINLRPMPGHATPPKSPRQEVGGLLVRELYKSEGDTIGRGASSPTLLLPH